MTHSGEGRKRSRRIPHPSTLFLELVDSETPLKQNLAGSTAGESFSEHVSQGPSLMSLCHLPTPPYPPPSQTCASLPTSFQSKGPEA